MKSTVLIAISALALTTSAFAQGVKIKKAWEEAEKTVNEALADTNKKCGGSLKVSIDKASYGNTEDMINTASWCENPVKALGSLCDDNDYKEAVKGVKTVSCKYDASLKGGSPEYGNKLELKNGVFTHAYNKDSANLWDRARTFAKDNL